MRKAPLSDEGGVRWPGAKRGWRRFFEKIEIGAASRLRGETSGDILAGHKGALMCVLNLHGGEKNEDIHGRRFCRGSF